jgi:peptidoglycan/LPS O-acetylase OafA/YrhL
MKHIYLVLAALMLLCLAPMPYGYFQLVRFVAMVAFGMIAYHYYVIHKNIAAWVFGLLALLFQPIFKISLGRTIWNVIDVLVAILLIAIFILEKRMEQKTRVQFQPLPPDDTTSWMVTNSNFILKAN